MARRAIIFHFEAFKVSFIGASIFMGNPLTTKRKKLVTSSHTKSKRANEA